MAGRIHKLIPAAKYKYSNIIIPLTHKGQDKTKWPPFRRRNFQVHFLEWKLLNFEFNFTEICSLWSNRQYGSTDSDNRLVPNRWQAIIWTHDALTYWRIYVTRAQWVNTLTHIHISEMDCYCFSIVTVYHLLVTNPSSKPKLRYCNWTLMNNLQWNLNPNSMIFIQENAS